MRIYWCCMCPGAIFGVSDTSLSTITDLGSFNPPLCSATVRRNCIIMRLRQPNTNPMTNVTYNIPFNGASGRYVYMLLPSGDGIRIINVVRMLIVGSHIPNTPGVSICRAECAVDGCTNATCVYTPPATTHVATCPRDACSREFTGGQAIEYNSATRQCSACSASQYLARTSVGYQCASCPASCSGSRCVHGRFMNSAVICQCWTPCGDLPMPRDCIVTRNVYTKVL
eukprot:m.509195 g.509195  ORF g.509195 m.509195 type:complete len:227 (+) comp21888_c2_seq17:1988-2668(+)